MKAETLFSFDRLSVLAEKISVSQRNMLTTIRRMPIFFLTPLSLSDASTPSVDNHSHLNQPTDHSNTEMPSSPTSPSDSSSTPLPTDNDILPPDEAGLPPSHDDALEELYDHFQMHADDDHAFHSICDHEFVNGSLVLTVKYISDLAEPLTVKVPFSVLKRDTPLELA